ncbi:hypothetical protein D3C75_1362180 [compost metagenome]
MKAEILHVVKVEVGVATDGVQHGAHRRQGPPRENVALDKVDGFFRLFVALVPNGNGLQKHQPVFF